MRVGEEHGVDPSQRVAMHRNATAEVSGEGAEWSVRRRTPSSEISTVEWPIQRTLARRGGGVVLHASIVGAQAPAPRPVRFPGDSQLPAPALSRLTGTAGKLWA